MIVLGLDTTGAECSVSLVNDAQVLAHISETLGRGHAERLAPMVAEALDAAGLSPDQIDRVAVCTGPGGFTGLRVALAFAKGFALPRGLPVIGMDALALTHMPAEPETLRHSVPYKDIRRNEVMFGVYAGTAPLVTDHPKKGTLAEAKAQAERRQLDLIEVGPIDTRILAWLAHDADPAQYPAEPLYSRGPDAKLPGGKSA